MKKSTLFKLAMMGIAASSSASSLEGSDLSNRSDNGNILAAGCGGTQSARRGGGCQSAARPSNGSYYVEAQAPASHSCNGQGAAPAGGSSSSHGCSSPNGCSNAKGTPAQAPAAKPAAPAAQPVNAPNAQASSGSRFQYERTTNAPVAPAMTEQEKAKQAAEKAKMEATKNAAQQAPTNVPNGNMMPKSLTPSNNGSK